MGVRTDIGFFGGSLLTATNSDKAANIVLQHVFGMRETTDSLLQYAPATSFEYLRAEHWTSMGITAVAVGVAVWMAIRLMKSY